MRSMNEKLGVYGELRILELSGDSLLVGDALERALDDGTAVVDIVLKNLVVDIGLSVISRLLGGNAGSPQVYHPLTPFGFSSLDDIAITRMELGDAVSPSAPVVSDHDSVGSLLIAPSLTVTYPTRSSVRFSGLVPKVAFDGVTFTEEALLLRNGQVFAKTVFSKLKTASFALQIDHTFSFSRA